MTGQNVNCPQLFIGVEFSRESRNIVGFEVEHV